MAGLCEGGNEPPGSLKAISTQATKGNTEGGRFDPMLWIEFGVAQRSERLVRRTKDPVRATARISISNHVRVSSTNFIQRSSKYNIKNNENSVTAAVVGSSEQPPTFRLLSRSRNIPCATRYCEPATAGQVSSSESEHCYFGTGGSDLLFIFATVPRESEHTLCNAVLRARNSWATLPNKWPLVGCSIWEHNTSASERSSGYLVSLWFLIDTLQPTWALAYLRFSDNITLLCTRTVRLLQREVSTKPDFDLRRDGYDYVVVMVVSTRKPDARDSVYRVHSDDTVTIKTVAAGDTAVIACHTGEPSLIKDTTPSFSTPGVMDHVTLSTVFQVCPNLWLPVLHVNPILLQFG
ncbi:hypothetical protein ANN_25900 [Periplaneta americana]|uniref:Uncharacterized protein n=1 Tax=Periplaneta americana TaxID=6978 RepID=A0ABQ8S4H0_PERAM|nr:hypothetical protein ANN_25900 [Periplaneta americana]